jgi:hypothetical protein
LFITLILSLLGYATPVLAKPVVVSGDVAGLLSHTNVRLEFNYDGVMVGEKTEAEYTSEKVAEKNADEAGSGDEWLQNWNEDRTAKYHVKFVALMNKYLGKKTDVVVSETAENPDMVMLVRVMRIEPGFYSYVINRPAYLDLEITLVDGSDRSKVFATIQVMNAPGTAVPDVRSRVGEAYAKAAKDLAKWLAKNGI